MAKWYKFTTGEIEALITMVQDDVDMSETYGNVMDGPGQTGDDEEADREEVMKALIRKSMGEALLEKLEGGENDRDNSGTA